MTHRSIDTDSLERRLFTSRDIDFQKDFNINNDDMLDKFCTKSGRTKIDDDISASEENLCSQNSSGFFVSNSDRISDCADVERVKKYFLERIVTKNARDGEQNVYEHRNIDSISNYCSVDLTSEETMCVKNKNSLFSSFIMTLKRTCFNLTYRNLCFLSVCLAFGFGLFLGILIPILYLSKMVDVSGNSSLKSVVSNSSDLNLSNAFSYDNFKLVDDKERVMNSTKRLFLPTRRKLEEYRRTKVDFPSIHDLRMKNSDKYNYDNAKVKINKPKNYKSVSFTNDEDSYKDMNEINGTEFENELQQKLNIFDTSSSDDDNDIIIYKNIFWGPRIEKSLPAGFGPDSNENWVKYMKTTSAVKMEVGCGRMQNRLVTFLDGRQACVRYRQNTDQIQGELFSFYLAQILQLPNLAPSLVSLVNLTDTLWQNVATDIGSAQWNSNRPVVMTKYVPNLEAAHIPNIFKPAERHLNKFDIYKIIQKGADDDDLLSEARKGDYLLKKLTEGFLNKNDENANRLDDQNNAEVIENEKNSDEIDKTFDEVRGAIGEDLLNKFIELAQWSDLIIFDYLTANLDRIVNNLYNFQWNVNIMEAPAHNLAKKMDSDLLLFLDNESGLLHGYRLLAKYEAYHTLLLDNLCIFRKVTADHIKHLHSSGDIGDILNRMFKEGNGPGVLDVLPPLPEKSVKILNERIARVATQIKKCEEQFGR